MNKEPITLAGASGLVSPLAPPLTEVAERKRRHDQELEQLKDRLLSVVLSETGDPALRNQLLGAARDATALAWATSCSLLVFPLLFEEKVTAACDYVRRQAGLHSVHPDSHRRASANGSPLGDSA